MTQHRPSPLALIRARMTTALTDFARDTRGLVAVEAIILLPLVIWTYVAMFSFFDMLRMKSVNQKAAFTVADAYSRETNKIDDTYVDSTFALFQALTRSNSPAMRVSVLSYDGDTDKYEVRWSENRGVGADPVLTDNTVNQMRTQLPVVASGDEFVLVETWNDYVIPFKIGMEDFELKSLVFINPRFADQLKWDDGSPT
ncbi:TadE/TadG family type IV pilus assembly protein [Pseudooceanicola sp.]|uniref:TadE/TadG family type IV pilus assembly protein n=1 Tax=Pseudooceanicola sp. TaxID=1914328 RepID=UPI0035C67064